MKSVKVGVLVSLIAGLVAGNAFATTYYARVDGDDSKDGKSWANAVKTLSKLMQLSNGTELILSNGVYSTGQVSFNRSNVILRGWSTNAADTVLDAGGASRVLTGNGTSGQTICNLTFRNGSSSKGGGLVFFECTGGGQTGITGHTISNCVFDSGTSASAGGGVSTASRDHFIDCVFRNCSGVGGGAVYVNGKGGMERFTRCTFIGNKSTGASGGAIQMNGSIGGELTDCMFEDNEVIDVNSGGGAIAGHFPQVTGCTFRRNKTRQVAGRAPYGGAWYYSGPSSPPYDTNRFENCTFDTNFAAGKGGACYTVYATSYVFSNCTFHANQAMNVGSVMSYESYSARNGWWYDCTFSDNICTGSVKGTTGWTVIHADGVQTVLERCTFKNNRSSTSAGCIYTTKPLRVENCSFIGNEVVNSYPGQMVKAATVHCTASATVRNCLFLNNANRVGRCGAIYVSAMTNFIDNCTFVGNCSTNDYCGNAIGSDTSSVGNAGSWYANNVYWNNTNLVTGAVINYTTDGNIKYYLRSFNCWGNSADAPAKNGDQFRNATAANGNKVVAAAVEPEFADFAGGNLLPTTRTLRNAGRVRDWMTSASTDRAGRPRIIGSAPDIGCYEADDPGLLLFVR